MTHWCSFMLELLCTVWANNGGELPNHHCRDNAAPLCEKGYCWCCCLAEPNKVCTRFCTSQVIFFLPISWLQLTLKRLIFGETLDQVPGLIWPNSRSLGTQHPSSTKLYTWHNAVRQIMFSWNSPNPLSSIRSPDREVWFVTSQKTSLLHYSQWASHIPSDT